MTYLSAAIAPPSPWVGQSCYFARPQEWSDRRGDRRRDDGNARAGADADTDRDGDLAHGEATGGERDDAARERKHRDDLAARALEEIGELVERRVEGRVGAGECRNGGPEGSDEAGGDPEDSQQNRTAQ